MKNPIYFLIFIFLCTLSHAEENWYLILSQVEEKMHTQSMSYVEHSTHADGKDVWQMIKQQRNEDGTVWRMEELLPDGEKNSPNPLAPSDYIRRTYYTDLGETLLYLGKDKAIGIHKNKEELLPMSQAEIYKTLSTFTPAPPSISGKSILHNGIPCWEITDVNKSSSAPETYKYIIDKEKLIYLATFILRSNGTLEHKTQYSNYDFSPSFPKDTFVIPKDAEIIKAKDLKDFLQKRSAIFLDFTHEIHEESTPKPSRWTSFWRKVKRNPTPHIVGAAVALAGISFGTAAILKRREKKRK